MDTEKEDMYIVSGGYLIDDFKTIDYNEAMKAFLNRVRHTKPLLGSIIEIHHIVSVGDLIIKVELIHRVMLL